MGKKRTLTNEGRALVRVERSALDEVGDGLDGDGEAEQGEQGDDGLLHDVSLMRMRVMGHYSHCFYREASRT